MSLFCNNIKSDLPGQKWMRDNINYVVSCYLDGLGKISSIPHFSDIEEMSAIRSEIIRCWICNPALKEFNISGTSTHVIHSSINGYKYEVIVNVRFEWETDMEHYVEWETDMEHYVEYIRVPIIKKKQHEHIQ